MMDITSSQCFQEDVALNSNLLRGESKDEPLTMIDDSDKVDSYSQSFHCAPQTRARKAKHVISQRKDDLFDVLNIGPENQNKRNQNGLHFQDMQEEKSSHESEEVRSTVSLSESEFIPKMEKIDRKQKKRTRIIHKNKTDLNKNNFSNIVRFVVKMLLESSQADSLLTKYGINFNNYKKFIQNLIVTDENKDRSCSRVNLSNYLSSLTQNQEKMKRIFIYKFEKLLRKNYLIQALQKGRMTKDKHLNYIRTKNTQLLYFGSFMSSSPKI